MPARLMDLLRAEPVALETAPADTPLVAHLVTGEALHPNTIGALFKGIFARADLPDFFGPFQSWRTASVASVEQYRCLNSLGVR